MGDFAKVCLSVLLFAITSFTCHTMLDTQERNRILERLCATENNQCPTQTPTPTPKP